MICKPRLPGTGLIAAAMFLSAVLIALSTAADAGGPGSPLVIDIVRACRMPVENVKGIIKISPSAFHVVKRDDPVWGHEEDWELADKAELERLGLRSFSISIEQGVFRAIYITPVRGNDGFTHNLGYAGLGPNDVTGHDYNTMRWHTATDRKGLPILIQGEGTLFECFEHRPGH